MKSPSNQHIQVTIGCRHAPQRLLNPRTTCLRAHVAGEERAGAQGLRQNQRITCRDWPFINGYNWF